MNIAYFEPLGRAWSRMKMALFKPFDLNKWFVVGFNAFLAGLLDGGNRGSSSARSHRGGDFGDFLNFPHNAWDWLINHPGWFIGIIFIALFVIALIIVLTWLSSRGTFMFLDNVVQDKAEIAKPWKRYRKEGNSLFLWRLGFGLVCFVLIIMFFIFFFISASHLYDANYHRVPVLFIVQMALLFLLMLIVIGYISMFLKNFVAPIMYKNNITTSQAWRRFLSIFKRYPFHFILFGLLAFVLTILFIIFVVVAGLLTCCIGLILFIIPYIGTVVTLPIWYTYRAFSLEFLAQFGPENELFPSAKSPSESASA